MILQALVRCYDALVAKGKVQKPGWSPVKVTWGMELDADGNLIRFLPLASTNEKGKAIPQSMPLPDPVKRSSGIASNFLCDNAGYMLGLDSKGRPERTKGCFDACAELHRKMLANVQHPMALAILRFFEKWNPADAETFPLLQPYLNDLKKGGNLIFCLNGKYAQDVHEIRQAWDEAYASDENVIKGRCLVTGDETSIAILHPSIKGIYGGQATGSTLVGFNARAFESYGREESQGLNAPVGTRAAFAYGSALNYMLREPKYHNRLDDTTLVFWAEGGEAAYSGAIATLMGFGGNELTQDDLSGVMDNLCHGKSVCWENVPLNPDNRFYILGLSPNSARLSVRFFLQDTFGGFVQNLQQHYEDTSIIRPSFDERETLSVWSLLKETANPNSRDKKAPDRLVGELIRAVLTGSLYPLSLFMQAETRIRAEKEVSRGKAAIIKGYLTRYLRFHPDSMSFPKEVLNVKLNGSTTYPPYLLGRLFAVLENIQFTANPGINATIKDRYFNSACASPATVFPTLLRLSQSHQRKLDGGLHIHYDKMLTSLMGGIGESFPDRLSLQDQGIFQLGYYHQKQQLFTKKEDQENV